MHENNSAGTSSAKKKASARAMGLPPLEYIECYLDSPSFREIIVVYEKELEENAVHVKSLVKECRHMIQATEGWWTDGGWLVEAWGKGGGGEGWL